MTTTVNICSKCNISKPIVEFGKTNSNRRGFLSRCIMCCNQYKYGHYLKNKEHFDQYRINYRSENKELIKERSRINYNKNKVNHNIKTKRYAEENRDTVLANKRKYYMDNKEKFKEVHRIYYINNRDKIKANANRYYELNKEPVKLRSSIYGKNNKEKNNKRTNNRKIIDPLFKLKGIVRNRLLVFLKIKNLKKTQKMSTYLGCSVIELKIYLESKFQPGMTWNNWSRTGWHIDHIIPLSSAKTEEEIYKLCHYTNLQPLWAKDNLRKHNKIDWINDAV